ncbi:MAG: hypothetical protein AAGL49_10515 [Pseudomonadota bacterium]
MNAPQTDYHDRVIRAIGAYGADPSRWPADVRQAYAEMRPTPEIEAALAAEARLDAALDGLEGLAPAAELRARVLASAPQSPAHAPRAPRIGLGETLMRFFETALSPQGALAAIALVGVAVGVLGGRDIGADFTDQPELQLAALTGSSDLTGWIASGAEQ